MLSPFISDHQFETTKISFLSVTINPLLSPQGAYLFQAHLRGGGLFKRGGLSNLEKTMVSVLNKKLGYKVEQLKNKKAGGHTAVDQNQI